LLWNNTLIIPQLRFKLKLLNNFTFIISIDNYLCILSDYNIMYVNNMIFKKSIVRREVIALVSLEFVPILRTKDNI
jgi:hypothetical protein